MKPSITYKLLLCSILISAAKADILVVGSVNVDIIVPVHRLMSPGETTTARSPSTDIAVGGKGANQAVAAARLLSKSPINNSTIHRSRFICRFGNDGYSDWLQNSLIDTGVDISGCGRSATLPSGQGIVLLEPDGTASSVVVQGANDNWDSTSGANLKTSSSSYSTMVDNANVVMLQREIPEHVNLAVATAASKAGIPIVQDVGGADRPISKEILKLVDFLAPNESELQRLTNMPTSTEEQVLAAARELIKRGARNVLVTLAERGSLLVSKNANNKKGDVTVLKQEALAIPGGVVVDGTAAGDAFRAGFAVGLVHKWPLTQCMQLAAAAGAVAVSKMGAVPSLPTLEEVIPLLPAETAELLLLQIVHKDDATKDVGDTTTAKPLETCSNNVEKNNQQSSDESKQQQGECPYKFASRLNSMQARRDLIHSKEEAKDNVLGWIARQKRVQGLDLVDLNYPQHTKGVSIKTILRSLNKADLSAGAVCIRFPSEYRLGAFTNPDPKLRSRAVQLAIDGCRVASDLGARDLIVWSPYDGYDYTFQIDYDKAWKWTVESYQQLADACPAGIRVSIEPKPTDPATRYSIVPSTAAALLLAQHVNRPNFGITLDVGHMLLAGEHPAQSVALVGKAGKMFGVQLNDAHVKLGAEDGLAFGAINPRLALELVYWLKKVNYDGHIYYDTFPFNEDPVREAEYNIRRFKALWKHVDQLTRAGIENLTAQHDSMGILELLETLHL